MIQFDHVSKVYPNGTVGLDDVNLTIQDGEFVAIIGRSGAGKNPPCCAPSTGCTASPPAPLW